MGNIGGLLYTKKPMTFTRVKEALEDVRKKRFNNELEFLSVPPDTEDKTSGFRLVVPEGDFSLELWLYTRNNISGKGPRPALVWAHWLHLVILGELEQVFDGTRWDECDSTRWHSNMAELQTFEKFCASADGFWGKHHALEMSIGCKKMPDSVSRVIKFNK